MDQDRISEQSADASRRRFLRALTAAGIAGATAPAWLQAKSAVKVGERGAPAGGAAVGPEMVKFPEKTDLILLTDRPPNLETPLKYFREEITPNDAFFVRWHLGQVPTSVDLSAFELNVGGHVNQEQSLSIDDLKKDFEPVSIIAVNQCSGNSRSMFAPRVTGGQWANGAVGNAKWTGVRLADLLKKAKPKAGAVDVSFKGLDKSPAPTVPDFVKSLSMDKASEADVIVAYEMNGEPLPMLNGFPLRLVVPGWFATYWVKALKEITVLPKAFDGFWMAKGYRVPKNPEMNEMSTDLAKETVPISKMPVRSLIVTPEPSAKVARGAIDVQGIAFDGGSGIQKVQVSVDAGKTWSLAELGHDIGKYSFRKWTYSWKPAGTGRQTLQARATSNDGQTQPMEPTWNRSGYGRNVIERVEVEVGA